MLAIKFFFIFAILSLLLVVFNMVMRRYLKIEKSKISSDSHVNERYEKISWIITIIFVVMLLMTSFYISTNADGYGTIWNFIPAFLLLMNLVLKQIIRTFMEWKYSTNRKAYILTISQLAFALILAFIIMWITLPGNSFNFF